MFTNSVIMATRKIKSAQELKDIIKERMIKLMESDVPKSLGDAAELEMNSLVDDGGKLPHDTPADDATKVKMNANDSKGTADVGAQVKVSAGAVKGSDGATAGQATAKMEEKSSSDKSVKAGGPFVESPSGEMNSMDKEGDDETKTFVEAGSEGVGEQPATVGQKKAEFDEAAPKSKETEKKIADAIQMKEGMKFKGKAEMLKFVNEEAKRIAKLI